MKISSALNVYSDLTIMFGNEPLHVTYKPSSVTLAELDRLRANPDPMRFADQIREQVVQWDLEDDATGKIVTLNRPESPLKVVEQGVELPVEALSDPIVDTVPVGIMLKVLIAIQEDQRPSPQA